MASIRFSRTPTGRSRARGQRTQRRRRSERLESYRSTLPGIMVPEPAGRVGFPSPGEVGQWVARHRLALALIAICGLLLAWFFLTDDFYVYDAHIEGTVLLTPEEIYTEAQLEGLSIFWVNPPALAASLKQNPLVKDAVVTARLPHHVSIQIEERVPVAVWQSGATSLYVDREGWLFPLRGDATGAVVVRDLRGESAEAGTQVDTEAIQTALELARLIPSRRAFDWEPAAGISFITDGGWRVSFGDHYRLEVKAAAYEAFTQQIAPFEKVELLDLSAPEHPYYRLLPEE